MVDRDVTEDLPALPPALAKAVDETLAAVLAGHFPTDPLLGPEVSDLVSKAASLQKRHGHLLELGIVTALRASGRFEVLTTVNIPITAAADSLIASTPPETVERVALRYDAPVQRTVNLDFIVIDEEAGWAGGYDCKRGNGALTKRLMRPLVRDMECAGVLLRSFLRDRGYPGVFRVMVGLIDVYGSSGIPEHLALRLEDLDAHFGVPVTPVIAGMNARLVSGFRRALPGLVAPVQAVHACERLAQDRGEPPSGPATMEPSPARARTPARLSGPTARAHYTAGGPRWTTPSGHRR